MVQRNEGVWVHRPRWWREGHLCSTALGGPAGRVRV
jgi:hypothetical protein